MRESFVFNQSFYEALRELPDKSRLKVYDSVCEYGLSGIEPELTGMEKAIFTLIKSQIDRRNQRVENGKKGGKKRQDNLNHTSSILEPNPKYTSSIPEPYLNHTSTTLEPYLDTKEKVSPDKKERTKEKNITLERENITPLFNSPQGEEKTYSDLFFEKYSKYAKDKAKMRKDVDYKVLLKEFDRSTYLRTLYTVKQINDIYPLIKAGDYRDKVDVLVERAERERWYSNRKNKAQDDADKVVAMFMQNDVFKNASKRLRELDVEIVKCEFAANNGDDNAKKRLAKLTSEQATLTAKRRGIIERQGMSEEDLEPKWNCKKCQDTGYLADGRACDCYEKEG